MRNAALPLTLLCALACAPKPPTRYALAEKVSMPDDSLIPENAAAAFIPQGATLDRDAVCLEPPVASGLAAELERLDRRDDALVAAERESAGAALTAANGAAFEQWAKRVRLLRFVAVALPVAALGGVAAGALLRR